MTFSNESMQLFHMTFIRFELMKNPINRCKQIGVKRFKICSKNWKKKNRSVATRSRRSHHSMRCSSRKFGIENKRLFSSLSNRIISVSNWNNGNNNYSNVKWIWSNANWNYWWTISIRNVSIIKHRKCINVPAGSCDHFSMALRLFLPRQVTSLANPPVRASLSCRLHPPFTGSFVDFRHLISVCHNHSALDQTLGSTLSSASPSTNNILCNSPNKFSNLPHQDSLSSSSTPTTPNMSRLRTLTCKSTESAVCLVNDE